MSVKAEVIKKIKDREYVSVGKTKLPVTGTSRQYVHFGERRAGVVYEVWCREHEAFAQLRGPLGSEIYRTLERNVKLGMDIKLTKSEFGIHAGPHVGFDKSADCVVEQLIEQLTKLYEVFEVPLSNWKGEKQSGGGVKRPCVERVGGLNTETETPNTVSFEPFVGKDYNPNGSTIFKKRILVVGASHYCDHYIPVTGCSENCKMFGKYTNDTLGGMFYGDRCQLFSRVVIEAYIKRFPGNWKKTFTKFLNAFIEGRDRGSRCLAHDVVINNLVDVEYVQGAEGRSDDETNAILMGDNRNFNELEDVIDKMNSEVVVLWGPRVVHEVYNRIGEHDYTKSVAESKIKNRTVHFVACLPHPSFSGFKPEKLRDILKSVGVKPLEEA